jgi:hypothetical protein
MRSTGFGDLPSEVRNRIYQLAAADKDRLIEKHVSRRSITSTSDTFFATRGYYGLTQASRETRQGFRELYLSNRAISVHIRDAKDYLETIYPSSGSCAVPRETINIWLTIRTDVERRGKYDTPIEIKPLLHSLFNIPGLDFEFDGKGSAIFNQLFIGYESEWKQAIANEFKNVELKEPSMFGMKLVFDSKSNTPWVKQIPISVTRLPHVPEDTLPWFTALGLDIENDMIFVRRGAPKWMKGEFFSGK